MTAKYTPAIGLEIHVQLNSKNKLFSRDPNPETNPDTLLTKNPHSTLTHHSPFIRATPGTIPELNHEAVEKAVIAALALNAQINTESQFDRKHYFHHDLPRAYQITQDKKPLAQNAYIEISTANMKTRRIRIRQIHIEDDTAKSDYYNDTVNVDLSRAGIPLIEIVTEPDIECAEDAAAVFREIREILLWNNVSNANLERANMRCDANVSLTGTEKTVITEIKNLNSYKFLENAVNAEIIRQNDALNNNNPITPQTLYWDNDHNTLIPLRQKNTQNIILPEPNIPTLVINQEYVERIKKNLPPEKNNYIEKLEKLGISDAETYIRTPENAEIILELAQNTTNPKRLDALLKNELQRLANNTTKAFPPIPTAAIHELITLLDTKKIASIDTYEILEATVTYNCSPRNAAEKINKIASDNYELIQKFCRKIMEKFPKQLEEYRNGQTKLFAFFIGQTMNASTTRLDPETVRKILARELNHK